ncbi:MAG TPA: hypothetical protein VIY72_07990, partial [Acidimicrobiales bacterium]
TTTGAPTTTSPTSTEALPLRPPLPAVTTTAPPPPPGPVVVVYGDSLVWEARSAIRELLRGPNPARVEALGGAALCDFSNRIVENARTEPTRMVVIAFSGNTLTTCARRLGPSPTAAQVAAMYAADLDWVVGHLRALGIPVLLVGSPPSIGLDGVSFWTPINAAWQDAAARWSAQGAAVSYADAGGALSDGAGQWTGTLPCLPFEDATRGCSGGVIAVRAPDTGHFCPQLGPVRDGVAPECAVWSSGAWRYGRAIAHAVQQRL